MFFDERIELERGKIARGGMLIAALFSLLSAVLRGINITRNMSDHYSYSKTDYFWSIATECIIASVCILCLLAGVIYGLGKRRDERFAAEEARFYKKAGIFALLTSLAAYAFFLPFSLFLYTNINFVDVTSGSTVYQIFLLLTLYLVYTFKKREIYFNYSIIASPRYPQAVLKNIGKLGLGCLACLTLSLCGIMLGDWMFSVSSRTTAILLICLLEHAVLFVILALLYALFSLLERVSYQKRRLLSGATFATLLAVILFQGLYGVIWGVITNAGLPLVESMTLLSGFLWMPEMITLAFVVFVIYYDSEYRGQVRDGFTRAGTLCLLFSEVVDGGVLYLFTLVRNILIDHAAGGSIRFYHLYSDLLSGMQGLIHITFLVGFALLILGPVRRGLVSKAHIVAVVLSFASFGVQIFLYSQSSVVNANLQELVNLGLFLLRYLYLAVFLFCTGKNTAALSEDETA